MKGPDIEASFAPQEVGLQQMLLSILSRQTLKTKKIYLQHLVGRLYGHTHTHTFFCLSLMSYCLIEATSNNPLSKLKAGSPAILDLSPHWLYFMGVSVLTSYTRSQPKAPLDPLILHLLNKHWGQILFCSFPLKYPLKKKTEA